ncbi:MULTISPECIES: hypothetical protein [Streptomyces]|uniref:Secreted protein n=1 Tax=Streptomyces solicathayae TaxID=3081768 RepID=A0ABZ0M3F2_9ACTN|nr:hypothetical protein [Streptomyces sp. HUAS YS2]WOX26304.1 hypothetical protein R2D22_34955 [Streptomyces sp. HUAS YS2]
MSGMFRLSSRSWLILSVPVVALVVWAGVLAFPSAGPGGPLAGLPPRPAVPLPDAPLPGGGVAQLSKCRVDEDPRPAAKGSGERGKDPQLGFGGWSAQSPGAKQPGRTTFSLHAFLRTIDRPLLLDAPIAERRVTVDIYGPHGEGRRASARGLSATVVDGKYPEGVVPPPSSGAYRVKPGDNLLLKIDLPAAAVCPGHTLMSVGRCTPETTNDAQDCPVVTFTLSDPAIRAYRSALTGEPESRVSDRLVAVSMELERSET